MKIIVAPDSFKGSISSADAAEAIKKGILRVDPHAEVITHSIADGGEGTLDALLPKEKQTEVTVTGPLGDPVVARYGMLGDRAIIEMASAAGLTLIPPEKRSAARSTTYGVGELIRHALKNGCRSFMLTVGGSATNDGGCGMMCALGVRFLDKNGNEFVPMGGTLSEIAEIRTDGLEPALSDCEILIATDVKNPLLGETGCTYVYSPQKGADADELAHMEQGMTHYAEVLRQCEGVFVAEIPGCGAGGGISAPLLALTHARIQSGIETVLDVIGFDRSLEDAHAVITGEGKIDVQSLYGKAISGVADRAKGRNIPVYCFVGCVGDDREALKSMGIAEIYDVASLASSPEDSMTHADLYLEKMAETWMGGLK
ncbi:MAG: glycerate kinase [Clostridia bacterium]|nr:glycerate kinase [Clostridia bacterium]